VLRIAESGMRIETYLGTEPTRNRCAYGDDPAASSVWQRDVRLYDCCIGLDYFLFLLTTPFCALKNPLAMRLVELLIFWRTTGIAKSTFVARQKRRSR